ncbi:alkaline phosphatase family protein [Nonomuraea salmonea]|uniref:alkaline phosphatase family protein n=1 Tax=Nonomuraea salmonea TaxID=46181 RepID=UPI0031ED4A8B
MSALNNKVLVVGMDGLRYDRLVALGAPVLAGLMSSGAYGTSKLPYGEAGTPRTESPGEVVPKSPEPGEAGRVIASRTDSGPGWSSIATGVWPDKHGVVDNAFTDPRFLKYPDFLTRAATARPGLATAAFFSWDALAEHGAFGPAIGHRFVLDGYAVGWSEADAQVTAAAVRHLADGDPGAVFVYLGDTDEVAHALGPPTAPSTPPPCTPRTPSSAGCSTRSAPAPPTPARAGRCWSPPTTVTWTRAATAAPPTRSARSSWCSTGWATTWADAPSRGPGWWTWPQRRWPRWACPWTPPGTWTGLPWRSRFIAC